MDFATRDSYRHVIEKIAKKSFMSEEEVAQIAIGLAEESSVTTSFEDRKAHVGFYLIDKGLKQLEELAKKKFSVSSVLRKLGSQFPLLFYTGSILLMTVLFTGGLLAKAYAQGLHGWWLGLIGMLFLLCTSQLAVSLINWMSTLLTIPKPLPKMDFSEGIPPEYRTLVVIPAILINTQNIQELIDSLEVRFLANRDENLHFSLLTDFQDSDKETIPEDQLLVQLAHKKIVELNEKYQGSYNDTFSFFIAPGNGILKSGCGWVTKGRGASLRN